MQRRRKMYAGESIHIFLLKTNVPLLLWIKYMEIYFFTYFRNKNTLK